MLHEAGLARVPIIAAKVGGITDIISDPSEGTLIDPTDQTALEAALRDFLRAPHTYNDKTQNLQSKLQQRSVAHMTASTVAVYDHN